MTQAFDIDATRPATRGLWLRHVASVPFVYGLLVPLAVLDISVCLYQAITFRFWGLARVSRREHLILDRHRLPYLNPIERVNCAYCGYANGVLSFAREVAARTEQYWCPIKHATEPPTPHGHYASFIAHGDGADLNARIEDLRAALPAARPPRRLHDAVEHLAERYGPYPVQDG